MPTFSTEKFERVYNDNHGEYIEIRPDRDSLGLIEIIRVDDLRKETIIVLHPAEAYLVADSIHRVVRDLDKGLKT